MKIKVLYFASVREAVGSAGEEVDLPDDTATADDLRRFIAARGTPWNVLVAMTHLRCAVNQTMSGFDTPLHSGDEVAFFPPVTGG